MKKEDVKHKFYYKGKKINKKGLIVTSRILTVDLLKGFVPARKYFGVFVYDCNKLTEHSNESFIIR
jgi:hypothetical protein